MRHECGHECGQHPGTNVAASWSWHTQRVTTHDYRAKRQTSENAHGRCFARAVVSKQGGHLTVIAREARNGPVPRTCSATCASRQPLHRRPVYAQCCFKNMASTWQTNVNGETSLGKPLQKDNDRPTHLPQALHHDARPHAFRLALKVAGIGRVVLVGGLAGSLTGQTCTRCNKRYQQRDALNLVVGQDG